MFNRFGLKKKPSSGLYDGEKYYLNSDGYFIKMINK